MADIFVSTATNPLQVAVDKVRKADGTEAFRVHLRGEHKLPYNVRVGADGRYIGTVEMQNHIETMRESLLIAIAQTPSIFKSAPTMQSLQAITPVWGFLFQSGFSEGVWGPNGYVEKENPDLHPASGDSAQLSMKGLEISRRSILPIWGEVMVGPTCIDFDFEEDVDAVEDDRSVCSVDFIPVEEGSATVCLRDEATRKRAAKAQVREALRRAHEARRAAEAAEEAFFGEFDLSEDESDFSSDDDE